MTTVSQVIALAASQIGTRESPPGSNRQKYGAWYAWNGVAWCQQFVSWVMAQAGGLSLMGGKYAYTPYAANWFKNRGQFYSTPRPGDHVFFDWGTDLIQHVGIVEKVLGGGIVQTIEGNTSAGTAGSQSDGGGVFRRRRSLANCAGFGRPCYTTAPAPKPTPTQEDPVPNITAAVNGTDRKITPGRWKTVELTNAGGTYSATTGSCVGTSQLQVKLAGLPAGTVVQARAIVVRYIAGKTTTIRKTYPITEILGTTGQTAGSALQQFTCEESTDRLRWQIYIQGSTTPTLTYSRVSAQYWKK